MTRAFHDAIRSHTVILVWVRSAQSNRGRGQQPTDRVSVRASKPEALARPRLRLDGGKAELLKEVNAQMLPPWTAKQTRADHESSTPGDVEGHSVPAGTDGAKSKPQSCRSGVAGGTLVVDMLDPAIASALRVRMTSHRQGTQKLEAAITRRHRDVQKYDRLPADRFREAMSDITKWVRCLRALLLAPAALARRRAPRRGLYGRPGLRSTSEPPPLPAWRTCREA